MDLPQGFKEEHNVIYGVSHGGLMHLKLNRPKKMNALITGMYLTLRSQLAAAKENDKVKAVLVYGAGGNFSAGNDISNFNQEPPPQAWVEDMLWENATFDKPVFYFVQGCCVGVIATMAAFADFVYCSEDAFFFLPFMLLNISPEGMCSQTYPETMGPRKASEVILS